MVGSTDSQTRVIVKRRGSKWRVADAESLSDLDASPLDIASQDDRSTDPRRDREAAVLAN
jgi:hypothetical protein